VVDPDGRTGLALNPTRRRTITDERPALADPARIVDRLIGVCQRGFGIAKQPLSRCSPGQNYHFHVLSKPRRKRAMLVWIVEHNRPIEVRSAFGDVAGVQHTNAEQAGCLGQTQANDDKLLKSGSTSFKPPLRDSVAPLGPPIS
jgi:hypothetical protein